MPPPNPSIEAQWSAARNSVAAYIASLVRGHDDREDVLQQTALWLLEHADQYSGDGFLPWALSVARYRVFDHWKRARRDNRFRPMAEAVEQAFVEEDRGDKEEDARIALIKGCMEGLSPSHRQLVQERYAEEVPLQDLAARRGRTTGSLAVTFFRLRNTLAECVERKMKRRTP